MVNRWTQLGGNLALGPSEISGENWKYLARIDRSKSTRMNAGFFVPGANDSHHAQDLYHTMRDRISRQCGTVTDERIYHLKFHHGGALCNVAVGDSFRYLDEQSVLGLFDREGCYFVCTSTHGAIEGEPLRVAEDAVLSIEEFTTSA